MTQNPMSPPPMDRWPPKWCWRFVRWRQQAQDGQVVTQKESAKVIMLEQPLTVPSLSPPISPHVIARKRVAAGALFLDEAGRILLVNPTYKPLWEIPGGMVEADEAPLSACRREIMEELGLTIAPGFLLSIGYLQAHADRGDALRFIFWGGRLDSFAIAQISLQEAELSEYRFVTLDEAAQLLRPSLHAQLVQSIRNVSTLAQGEIPQNYWEEA